MPGIHKFPPFFRLQLVTTLQRHSATCTSHNPKHYNQKISRDTNRKSRKDYQRLKLFVNGTITVMTSRLITRCDVTTAHVCCLRHKAMRMRINPVIAIKLLICTLCCWGCCSQEVALVTLVSSHHSSQTSTTPEGRHRKSYLWRFHGRGAWTDVSK